MAAELQNYSNHVRRVPLFLVVALVLLATAIGAVVNLVKSWDDHQRLYSASLILALSLASIVVAAFSRRFPLVAQDRAIAAEESLRHYVLTGKLLDRKLTHAQIAALRFAADEEFPELVRRAVAESMKPDDIKRAVKSWRADFHRV